MYFGALSSEMPSVFSQHVSIFRKMHFSAGLPTLRRIFMNMPKKVVFPIRLHSFILETMKYDKN